MENLNKYDIECCQKTRPVYQKRYKSNGEEYLKKTEEIDIEEDLKEKQLEISRLKEIFNGQERLKINELIDEYTEETKLKELELMQDYKELDTYQFLNKTLEIEALYTRMPEEIRKNYKDLSKFSKEYLPKFTKEVKEKLENEKKINNNTVEKTKNQIEKEIEILQQKLKGENENV